jgi:alpha-1,2-mannosyltransferase
MATSSGRTLTGQAGYQPAQRRWWPTMLAALSVLLTAVAVAVVERARVGDSFWSTTDLHVYWISGRAVRTGHDPYQVYLPGFVSRLTLVYPPFAALLLAPLSLLSLVTLRLVWFTGIALALQAVVWKSLGRVGMRAGLPRLLLTLIAAAGLPAFDPVYREFWAGQVNVFLMLLVLADLFRKDGAAGKGIGVGLAAGVKLTPLIFVVYLALTRRVREALVALAAFAVTVAVAFAVLPRPAWHYWTSYAWDANRVFPFPFIQFNQCLRGTLARLLHSNDVTLVWLPVATVVLVVGLAVAVGLHRRGLVLEGVLACAVTGVLVSPIAWVYHWVWLVPVGIVLVAGTWRTRSPAWAALTAVALGVPAAHLYTRLGLLPVQPSGFWQQLEANSFVLVGLLLLASAALLCWSPRAVVGSAGEPHPDATVPAPAAPPMTG